jgi:hypothetical protein
MRFIHDNLYPLFAAMALIAAVTIWFAADIPSPPQARPTAAEVWAMPKQVELDFKKSTEAINTRNLWGIVAAATVKPPEWRVQGIASTGTERFILLAYEGKPAEMLKVGDALPDGAKIVEIEKDRFFIMTPDKQKVAFGMYKNEPAK